MFTIKTCPYADVTVLHIHFSDALGLNAGLVGVNIMNGIWLHVPILACRC